MLKHLPTLAISLVITAAIVIPTATLLASSKPASIVYAGRTYYRVTSTNKSQNTGAKVCALVDKACIGYTATGTNDICKALHPTAMSVVSISGSKSGFYCNGSPQKGPACEKQKNTCGVCPTCAVNVTCQTDIGGLFREMYVECGPLGLPQTSSKSSARPVKKSSSSSVAAKPPAKPSPLAGKIACDFFQTPAKKIASCKNKAAANAFCVSAMKSRLATATECSDNGRILCTRPCAATPAQTPLPRCAYDPGRLRGYEATPMNECGK